jgi:hypothetical protein
MSPPLSNLITPQLDKSLSALDNYLCRSRAHEYQYRAAK